MLEIGIPGGAELFVILIILGLPLSIIVLALVDILRSEFKTPENKIIWVIVTLLLPIIGALLYLLIGRSQRLKPSEVNSETKHPN